MVTLKDPKSHLVVKQQTPGSIYSSVNHLRALHSRFSSVPPTLGTARLQPSVLLLGMA